MRMRIAQLSSDVAYLAGLGWEQEVSRPAARAQKAIGPGERLRVIHMSSDGAPAVSRLRWGHTPATDGSQRPQRRLHARVDTAATDPALRRLWREGRCLVPLDGWFEWQGENDSALPFRIRLLGGAPMYAAAIADLRPGRQPRSGADVMLICAQEGNGLLDAQGHRPVILVDDDARAWLDPATTPEHARLLALDFLLPPPAFEWQALEQGMTAAPPPGDADSRARHARD